jgi:hypothetical protein
MSKQLFKTIRSLILNHVKLDKTNKDTAITDAIERLSNIDNIESILKKLYTNNDFKNLVDTRFKNLKNLIALITEHKDLLKKMDEIKMEAKKDDAELLTELDALEEEEAKKATAKEEEAKATTMAKSNPVLRDDKKDSDGDEKDDGVVADTKSVLVADKKKKDEKDDDVVADTKSVLVADKKKKDEKDDDVVADTKSVLVADKNAHPLFYNKLTEMEAKLPPILGNPNDDDPVYDQVADKEFCYKFLYCWRNNPSNQTNESVQRVYNEIIRYYDINFDPIDEVNLSMDNYTITFDVGFIINVKVVPSKGGLIPTQKRRKRKRAKKTNHTIKKDRVNKR